MRALRLFLSAGAVACFLGLGVARVPAQAADPLKQHFEAAQDAIRKGDQDRAATEYKAFLGDAIHRVANARARAGDLEQASRNFEEALPFAGSDPALLLDYASVLFDANRLPDAERTVHTLIDAHPDNGIAQALLGKIYFERKNYSSAKAAFIAAGPASLLEVWRSLAISYLQTQDLAGARTLLRGVIELLGDSPANRVAIATTYYYGDSPGEAIVELKKILAQSPSTPATHYYLGLAYLSRNEEAGYPKAIPEFEAEIKRRPDDFPSHYMLGYIFLKQRDFGAAQEELQRAAKLDPTDAGTQLSLAEMYVETRRLPEAEATLRKLIAGARAEVSGNILIRAHYMLGRLLQESGNFDEGAAEIGNSERLRKQLRLTSAEVSGKRVSKPSTSDSGEMEHSAGKSVPAAASGQEKAQAQAFISHLSPAIAEGYYNLAAISAKHQESTTAAQYMKLATAWDPTIATGGQR